MSSTHLSLHYHLIFGTKDHEPTIAPAWCPRLHAYMGGIISSLDAVPEIVGGVHDHVHILIGLRATHRLADVLREIKSSSSRWIHDEIRLSTFAWQEGYGAFTVSKSQRETVRAYIAGQEPITVFGTSDTASQTLAFWRALSAIARGKFVADGQYSATAVDKELDVLVMLRAIS